MDAALLLKKLIADGADEAGIGDRFSGNDRLFASCFLDFLEEPNFELLEAALAARDCEAAFDSGHALKGVSANLGLTAFSKAIGALVETLRTGTLAGTEAQFSAVSLQRERLRRLASEEKRPDEAAAENTPTLCRCAEIGRGSSSEASEQRKIKLNRMQINALTLRGTDVEGALRRLDGREEIYLSCLSAFLADPTMAELEHAITEQRWDDAFTAAHALKGVAGNMGFVPLLHAAGQLVVLIRGGRTKDIPVSFEQVNSCYRDISDGIRQVLHEQRRERRKSDGNEDTR